MCSVTFHASYRSSCWIFLFVAGGTDQKSKQWKDAKKKTLREYQFRFVRASLLHSRLFVLFIAIQNVECKEKKYWKVKRRAKSKAKWWAMLRKGKLNICYICQTFSHDFWPFKTSNNILQNFNLFSFSRWIFELLNA